MKEFIRICRGVLIFFGLIALCYYVPGVSGNAKEQEALFYRKLESGLLQCVLCPRRCFIPEGKRGFCGARENRGGTLYSLVYGRPVAVHIDPVEKKPLFHVLPGSSALSIATAGCNMECKFCQNWEISQRHFDELDYIEMSPENLVKKAKESGSEIIAYTYTEPTIFYEYMLATAKLAKQEGIKNIMHSNGYINEEPLRLLAKYLDAANIDLKGFTNEYYENLTSALLDPVLKSLKILKEEGVHLEITNLVLPGYNDKEEDIIRMCLWIKENLGDDVPVHFSRFFPMYKLIALNPTPVNTLEKIRGIALAAGLRYVYIGNVPGHEAEHTYCPACGSAVIKRNRYIVTEVNLSEGRCVFCSEPIKGIWR